MGGRSVWNVRIDRIGRLEQRESSSDATSDKVAARCIEIPCRRDRLVLASHADSSQWLIVGSLIPLGEK